MKQRPLASLFHVIAVESKEHLGFWHANCVLHDGEEPDGLAFEGLARDKHLATAFVYDKIAAWFREQSKKAKSNV